MAQQGYVRAATGGVLVAGGDWDLRAAARLDAELAAATRAPPQALAVDLSGLGRLDTAGAWLLHRTRKRLAAQGVPVEFVGLSAEHAALIEAVAAGDRPPPPAPERFNAILRLVERVGIGTLFTVAETRRFTAFIGVVVEAALHTALRPARLRFTPLVYHLEQVGLNALPIVGLLSLLIGLVLAYQGIAQLQRFGAEIFVVNLIGISVLREIGVLMTAIIVAGRSGSAFTAQIGAMKVREEIDAMRTIGLDPVEVLVLPRMLALILAMPLLAFFADLMGLIGGGAMCWLTLDIKPDAYLERLNAAIGLWTFGVGMIKAPVFAALIALVGCYQGMQVSGSAESVGRLTTRSVVQSIFLVITFDAIFSVVFYLVGI
jgi:phospholipid/cholesterol/gamma-HCH transport system permease protein